MVNEFFISTTDSIRNMVSDEKTHHRCGGAAVKEACRVIAATFLSLLLPLSFLLLSRLSTARYFSSVTPPSNNLTSLILTILVSVIAIGALIQAFTGSKADFYIRRRFAWILLFVIQFCLNLGIHNTVEAQINSYTVGKLVPARRLIFAFGLHEVTVFWRRMAVKPAVDETIFGVSDEGFSWAEKAALAVAFGYLWWRRLRDEAEALVVLPWVTAEVRMEVEAVDVLGWLLYYLTAAVGGVTVVKGLLWAVMRIFR